MSLETILAPNNLDLYCNSITSKHGVVSEKFSAYPSGDQSLSTSTFTTIVCNTTLLASSSYDTSTGAYTIPISGIYRFDVSVGNNVVMGGSGSPFLSVNLLSNGTPIRSGEFVSVLSTGSYVQPMVFTLLSFFSAGQVISLRSVAPTPNTNVTTYSADGITTYFSGELLAPLP